MSQHDSQPVDKLDLHCRQQLSALIDGELPTDEARFLLRRLEHDQELADCHARWQLCGQVLRGQACLPAPEDFAARVAAAVATESSAAAAATPARHAPRWLRWGGGALAASVAALALLAGRDDLPGEAPAPVRALPVVASTARLAPATAATVAATPVAAGPRSAEAPAASALAAAAPIRTRVPAIPAASRAQGAVRRPVPVAGTADVTAQVASVAAVAAGDPFVGHAGLLKARPWPRSALAPAAVSDLFTASLPTTGSRSFYPFEPHPPTESAASPHDPDAASATSPSRP